MKNVSAIRPQILPTAMHVPPAESLHYARYPRQHMSSLSVRGINAVNQVVDDRAARDRYYADRYTENNRVAEHGVPPQRKGDLRRTHVRRIIDVLDVG